MQQHRGGGEVWVVVVAFLFCFEFLVHSKGPHSSSVSPPPLSSDSAELHCFALLAPLVCLLLDLRPVTCLVLCSSGVLSLTTWVSGHDPDCTRGKSGLGFQTNQGRRDGRGPHRDQVHACMVGWVAACSFFFSFLLFLCSITGFALCHHVHSTYYRGGGPFWASTSLPRFCFCF